MSTSDTAIDPALPLTDSEQRWLDATPLGELRTVTYSVGEIEKRYTSDRRPGRSDDLKRAVQEELAEQLRVALTKLVR